VRHIRHQLNHWRDYRRLRVIRMIALAGRKPGDSHGSWLGQLVPPGYRKSWDRGGSRTHLYARWPRPGSRVRRATEADASLGLMTRSAKEIAPNAPRPKIRWGQEVRTRNTRLGGRRARAARDQESSDAAPTTQYTATRVHERTRRSWVWCGSQKTWAGPSGAKTAARGNQRKPQPR